MVCPRANKSSPTIDLPPKTLILAGGLAPVWTPSHFPHAILRCAIDKKTTATGGTAAVELERIAWGEMDAPWDGNVANAKGFHVERTKFACLRFRQTLRHRPAHSGLRRGNIARLPPLGAKTERVVVRSVELETR